jgi:hypothetical protein
MAKPDDKPTTFTEWVQKKITGATSPEMQDALAKMVSPKMKDTFAEMARQFQQPFQEEQDLPAVVSEPSSEPPSEPSTQETSLEPSTIPLASPPASTSPSPAPSASSASTPAPASAPETPRRPGQGPKLDVALDILDNDLFPPDGKAPRTLTYVAIWEMVNARAEKPISRDVVTDAVKLRLGLQRRR